jgi:hypothetical protein
MVLLPGVLHGDTVVLKNNLVIRGKITSETERDIVVEHAFGRTVVARSDISRIERDATRLEAFLDSLADVAYSVELRTAAPPLNPETAKRLRGILKKFPNHGEARRELGYVRKGNEWIIPGTKERITIPDAPAPSREPQSEMDISSAASLYETALSDLNSGRYRKATDGLRKIASAFPGTEFAKEAAARLEIGGALNVKKLEINGPSANRIDMVFIAEGYTNVWENRSDMNGDAIISYDEQAKFDSDVQSMLASLVKEPPFSDYRHYFNFYRINVVSTQVGADSAWRNPARSRQTVFGASHPYEDMPRMLVVDKHQVKRFVSGHVPFDVIVVIVNDAWGGSGSKRLATIGINRYETEISFVTWNMKYTCSQVLHELGHALASLGDEYDYGGVSLDPVLEGREPPFPNLTRETSREKIKWRHWIDADTPVPTPGRGSQIGLFEGAFYHKRGYYRPEYDCRMRDFGKPFCRVCREAIVRKIYLNVNLIEKVLPAQSVVRIAAGDSPTFSITSPARTDKTVSVEWKMDGRVIDGEAPLSRTLKTDGLTAGRHVLTVTLEDITSYVRSDPEDRLTANHEWEIFVDEK